MPARSPAVDLSRFVGERLLERNEVSARFFPEQAERLATACREMANRFARGGRLLAFGRGASATDAQHVSVEFVHPVIVGKRALPALDLSTGFHDWLAALLRPHDMVMGFGPPAGDPEVLGALEAAGAQGAQTFALPGPSGSYAVEAPSEDPFIHQEMVEILYHTLWETVHVFLEHEPRGRHDVGASGFLYPFLGGASESPGAASEPTAAAVGEVARSIRGKAEEVCRLRTEAATRDAGTLAEAIVAIGRRVVEGGTLVLFGNGGSATDANDLALDCVSPPGDRLDPIPAVSLAMEPANLSAIANDVGAGAMFLRQLVAQATAADVAVAISTSGGSTNIVAALEEARRRKLLTVALLGSDGGEVVRRGLADFPVVVRCDYIPRIQEVHASLYHVMREALGRAAGDG